MKIIKVRNKFEITEFHQIVYNLYKNQKNWIPHIKQDVESIFNPEKNSYHKHGEIERFKTILKTIPFPYVAIFPEERYLDEKDNPPDVKISFFKDGPNIKNISCYSNEENRWRKSKMKFIGENELKIILDGKFITERGRINCSLREDSGYWRWLGIQFVISSIK